MNVDGETDAYAQATRATRILQLTHPMIETPQRGGGGGGGGGGSSSKCNIWCSV
jgi:hypothetical protein